MLTDDVDADPAGRKPESTSQQAEVVASSDLPVSSNTCCSNGDCCGIRRARIAKMCSFEWIGQTVASLCWIASVFSYGISSTGDWLQLLAASAWLVANISAVVDAKAD